MFLRNVFMAFFGISGTDMCYFHEFLPAAIEPSAFSISGIQEQSDRRETYNGCCQNEYTRKVHTRLPLSA